MLQTPDRSWLPTSTAQSVLVYALNVLLLFNLTVIVVLLSGETVEPAKRAQTPAGVVGTDAVEVDQSEEPVEQAAAPVVHASPAKQVSSVDVPVEPIVLVDPAIETVAAPEPAQQTQAAPKQDDPPVTFFGVGLE